MLNAIKCTRPCGICPWIYFETGKGEAIYEAMKENGILIKFFKGNEAMPASIRLSIGTPEENRKVLEILKKVL